MSKIEQWRDHIREQRTRLYAMFRPTHFEFIDPKTGQTIIVHMDSPMSEATFNQIDATFIEALRRIDETEQCLLH